MGRRRASGRDVFRAALATVLTLVMAATLVSCAGQGVRDGTALRVWLLEAPTPQISHGYDDLVADFEHRHRGVRVELTRVPYQQYRDKLVLAVQGGTGPDVMVLDQIWTPEFAAAGLIRSLDGRLRAAGVRSADYFPGAWASNEWHGHTWGIPFNADAWERMYYNADLFRRAGLDPDRPPRTWGEWLTAAERVDRLPGKSGIGLIGCRDEASSVLTDSFVYSAGGRIIDGRRAVFDNAANRRAYTLYQRLARHAPSGVAGACAEDVDAQFTAGTTGMLLDGGWLEPTVDAAATFDWRVADPPAPEGRTFTSALGGWNMVVGSRAPNPALAFGFVRLATSSVRHQRAVNDSIPALRRAGESFVKKTRSAPQRMLRLLYRGRPRPITPVYVPISRAQQDAVQAIIGGADVADALATAQTRMQRAIDRP